MQAAVEHWLCKSGGVEIVAVAPMLSPPERREEDYVKPSVALRLKRDAIHAAVRRHRTANPRVFGSALHGTDTDNSDLDLLVDALPDTTLFDLGGLQIELETLLGIPVDLLTPNDLPVKFRATVLAEARAV